MLRPGIMSVKTSVTAVAPVATTTKPSTAQLAASGLELNLMLKAPYYMLHPGLSAGLLRDQLDAPVSATTVPGDEALFENPSDPQQRYYLPRYRLREGAGRYELGVALLSDGRWQLRVGLEHVPASALGDVGDAAVLPHTLSAWVQYKSGPTHSIERRHEFTGLTDDAAGGITATFELNLLERDSLLLALKDPAAHPRLLLTRSARIALPLPAVAAGRPAVLAQPDLRLAEGARIAAPAMTLMTLRDARRLPGARAVRPGRPGPPVPEAAPPLPRFRIVEHPFEAAVAPDPFVFDAQLHGYVYAGATIAPGHAERSAFQRIALPHAAGAGTPRHHAYFQDRDQPWVFHVLPDRLVPVRSPTPPFLPEMLVRLDSEDGSLERAEASLDVMLASDFDSARLLAAAEALRAHVPATAGGRAPELRRLQAGSRLLLSVPGASGIERRDFGDVGADLPNGFAHSLTLPLERFRLAWASLGARAADTLLTGELRVETGLGQDEVVPVELRLAQALGPLIEVEESPAAGDGEVGLRLSNPTESPVRVPALPVTLARGDARVEAIVDGLPPLPCEIAPGGSLDLLARPASPLAGSGPADAELDLRSLHALPDGDALLARVTDPTVPATYERTIDVFSPPGLFYGDEPESILLANIELRGGERVRLGAAVTEATLTLDLPLLDLLLGRDTEGHFAWRQQLVRRNGQVIADAAWREQDYAMIVVQAP